MKKYILGGIAVLIITTMAVWNVSLSSKNNQLSEITLANVEALAQEPGNGEICFGIKVSCIFTSQCEDLYYQHLGANGDLKYTYIYKQTDCQGTGSQCCLPDTELVSSKEDYVLCNGRHH